MGFLLFILIIGFVFWFFTKDIEKDSKALLNSIENANKKMEALTAKLQAKLDLKNAKKP